MSAPRYTKKQKLEMVKRFFDGEDPPALALEFGCHQSYPAILSRRYRDDSMKQLKAKTIRLSIECGKTGLFYGTSRDLKGLLIGEETPELVREKAPEIIANMYHASGIMDDIDVLTIGNDVWCVRAHKLKQ